MFPSSVLQVARRDAGEDKVTSEGGRSLKRLKAPSGIKHLCHVAAESQTQRLMQRKATLANKGLN